MGLTAACDSALAATCPPLPVLKTESSGCNVCAARASLEQVPPRRSRRCVLAINRKTMTQMSKRLQFYLSFNQARDASCCGGARFDTKPKPAGSAVGCDS